MTGASPRPPHEDYFDAWRSMAGNWVRRVKPMANVSLTNGQFTDTGF